MNTRGDPAADVTTVPQGNETIIREFERHDSGHVTIAHISDLHFTQDTKFPEPDPKTAKLVGGNDHLRNLVADIGDQKPDILVVTGDIAENPIAHELKNLLVPSDEKQGDLSNWNASLDEIFKRARKFLDDTCAACGINAAGLFVIPGNHDFRLQGTYSGHWWRGKYQAIKHRDESLQSVFARAFQGCGGDEDVTVACKLGNNPPIILRMACIDSNDTDAYLNFATGGVLQTNLEKIDRLKVRSVASNVATSELAQAHATVFRICLIHHHPLPVVTAENLRSVQDAQMGFATKIKSLWTTLTGEQTNIFKNGGTFLLKCLDNGVDLVVHGHQHRTWFSNIQYPARSDSRLLVAGAPSAGVEVDGSYGYCVYELDFTGNIKVTERKTPKNPIGYSPVKTFVLYGNDELRKRRRQQLISQLANKNIPDLGCTYGIAAADEVVRRVWIDEDGNARMTLTYRGLVPRGRETLPWLPIKTLSTGAFVGVEPPSIRILGEQDFYDIPEWKDVPLEGGEQGIVGKIFFNPRLSAQHPLSVEIEFLVCNAFQFVREYRRAISGVNQEFRSGLSRAVYSGLAKDVIMFPPRLGPPGSPQLNVFREGHEPDSVETQYCVDALTYSPEPGVISLSVRDPLPDFTYKMSWQLRSEEEFNRTFYADQGTLAFNRLAQTSPPSEQPKGRLTRLLESLKSQLSGAPMPGIIDDKTEVSLHIAVVTDNGQYGDNRTVTTELHRFAALLPEGASTGSNTKFAPGEGIAGQAFRSREPILFEQRGQQGSQFYVVRANQKTHSVLYCVPLPVIPSAGAPVYGVVSIGSYTERPALQQLTGNEAVRVGLTDVIMGWLNRKIQEILLAEDKT